MKKLSFLLVLLFFSLVFGARAQTVLRAAVADMPAPTAFRVDVVGKGDPVLLFPGFACPGDLWKETARELSKRYECHVFTFAGFGGVPPIGRPWLPRIRDAVVDYVHQRKLEHAVIIGHSLGGTLGLWLAATEPMLFKKVIVVDALPCMGVLMMPAFDTSRIVYDNPYSQQLLKMDSGAFRAMAQQQAAFMLLSTDKRPQVVDWIVGTDRHTYVDGYVDLLKLDLREDLAKIRIPVVVLAATHPNKDMIEKTYNEQYAKLRDKTFFYAEHSAHFIMYDQPDWLMAKINETVTDR